MLPVSNRHAATHLSYVDHDDDAIVSSSGQAPTRHTRRRRHSGLNSTGKIWIYLRRILSLPQMDFELALWQMLYLVIAPRRV